MWRTKKPLFAGGILLALAVFLAWRLVRPLNIFVVSGAFERPVETSAAPVALTAETCGECHPAFYDEWRTSMHSRAWTDPYCQADWRFDGSQQICKNCHIPLDRQQEQRVLGFRDADKWDVGELVAECLLDTDCCRWRKSNDRSESTQYYRSGNAFRYRISREKRSGATKVGD